MIAERTNKENHEHACAQSHYDKQAQVGRGSAGRLNLIERRAEEGSNKP